MQKKKRLQPWNKVRVISSVKVVSQSLPEFFYRPVVPKKKTNHPPLQLKCEIWWVPFFSVRLWCQISINLTKDRALKKTSTMFVYIPILLDNPDYVFSVMFL